MSKLPHLSKFVDDLSQPSCQKNISDSHIVLKSPDLSCETYLSTPQRVARTVTSQNNVKKLLHLNGSAKMKEVSKLPTCQRVLTKIERRCVGSALPTLWIRSISSSVIGGLTPTSSLNIVITIS